MWKGVYLVVLPATGKLLTLQINGLELCDPLGDKTVWGSIFELTQDRLDQRAIMLATKVRLWLWTLHNL